jgi:hypothetical protein
VAFCESQFGGNYGLALALVAGSLAVIIAVLTSLGGRRGRPSAPLAGDRLRLERKVRQWHCNDRSGKEEAPF